MTHEADQPAFRCTHFHAFLSPNAVRCLERGASGRGQLSAKDSWLSVIVDGGVDLLHVPVSFYSVQDSPCAQLNDIYHTRRELNLEAKISHVSTLQQLLKSIVSINVDPASRTLLTLNTSVPQRQQTLNIETVGVSTSRGGCVTLESFFFYLHSGELVLLVSCCFLCVPR